jgi:hypothetical protein
MQIVFSDAYEKCLDDFIEKLEGALRPMELVPSGFLKYSVELTLRRVFRVIRSVKSSAIPELDVQGPEPCSKFYGQSFDKLAEDLSDHAIMTKQEAYYRVKLSRQSSVTGSNKTEAVTPKLEKQTVKFAELKVKSEEKVGAAAKVCSRTFRQANVCCA